MSEKRSGFGHKGTNTHAKSLAESLLSGKPVARAAGRDHTPKLKPRAKPRFGRKDTPETFDPVVATRTDAPSPRHGKHHGTGWWAVMVVGMVSMALTLTALVHVFAEALA